MDLVNLWLLLRWNLGAEGEVKTPRQVLISNVLTVVGSTVYWLIVAAILTIIISRLS